MGNPRPLFFIVGTNRSITNRAIDTSAAWAAAQLSALRRGLLSSLWLFLINVVSHILVFGLLSPVRSGKSYSPMSSKPP